MFDCALKSILASNFTWVLYSSYPLSAGRLQFFYMTPLIYMTPSSSLWDQTQKNEKKYKTEKGEENCCLRPVFFGLIEG